MAKLRTWFNLSVFLVGLFSFLRLTNADIPGCDFYDTVDLTNSKKFSNGSYLYEGLMIPEKLTGKYNYELLFDSDEIETRAVPEHVRGCVCKLKPCVQFCCHPSTLKHDTERLCRKDLEEEISFSPYLNVTNAQGVTKLVHVLDDFALQIYIPCKGETGDLTDIEDWKLYENGTLTFSISESETFAYTKNKYCLSPFNVNDTYSLVPLFCPYEYIVRTPEKIKIALMCLSVVCMIITTIVYILLPMHRKCFGKCLICYFIALSTAFTLYSVQSLNLDAIGPISCIVMGYTTYYFLMAAFLWLSVISYDIWSHLHQRHNPLLYYSLYTWLVAGIMTLLTFIAENSNLNEDLKPGIREYRCMVDTQAWSAWIYLYGPVTIILIFNSWMFISIFRQIKQISKRVKNDAETRRVGNASVNFKTYLRLFFLMGIIWIFEIISFAVGKELPTDYLNASQGIILFVLFVCKPSIWKAFKDRIMCREPEKIESDIFEEVISLQDCSKPVLQPNDDNMIEKNGLNTRAA